MIFPLGSTRPTATLVPPMSTPMIAASVLEGGVISCKSLILHANAAQSRAARFFDASHEKYSSKRLREFVDGKGRSTLEYESLCWKARIFARCACALVVVVHRCALARGGC